MYNKRYERNNHRHSSRYDAYMNSPEWQQKRIARLNIDGFRCVMCGAKGSKTEPLQIHHLCSYRKLGSENVYVDLVSLCPTCHKAVHRMMKRVTDCFGNRGWTEVADS